MPSKHEREIGPIEERGRVITIETIFIAAITLWGLNVVFLGKAFPGNAGSDVFQSFSGLGLVLESAEVGTCLFVRGVFHKLRGVL